MFIRIPNPCSWWLFAGGKVSLAKVADSLCTFNICVPMDIPLNHHSWLVDISLYLNLSLLYDIRYFPPSLVWISPYRSHFKRFRSAPASLRAIDVLSGRCCGFSALGQSSSVTYTFCWLMILMGISPLFIWGSNHQ